MIKHTWKVQIALLTMAGLCVLYAVGAAVAQTGNLGGLGRDVDRLERQVERLDAQSSDIRVELKEKIARLEVDTWQIKASLERLQNLLYGALSALLLLLIETVWSIVIGRPKRES